MLAFDQQPELAVYAQDSCIMFKSITITVKIECQSVI